MISIKLVILSDKKKEGYHLISDRHNYKILILSSSDSFNTTLSSILSNSSLNHIQFCSDTKEAQTILTEDDFDFILINFILKNNDMISTVIDFCVSKEIIILLLVDAKFYNSVFSRIKQPGVFILSKPVTKMIMVQALNWLISTKELYKILTIKNQALEVQIEEQKLISQAKCILISKQNMSEPQAHHYIEKYAMNLCISKKSAAQNIVARYSRQIKEDHSP